MAEEVPAKKRIGVLALQGDFEAHGKALARAGAEAVEVRSADDLQNVDGLVIPGGESTTMWKLLRKRTCWSRCVRSVCAAPSLEPAPVLFCWLQTCRIRISLRSG